MKKILPIIASCVFLLTIGCAKQPHYDQQQLPAGVQLISHPDVRAKNPDSYFSKEYALINERLPKNLRNSGNQKPNILIGLALSGGGIRSNAFQLGLMSGLTKFSHNRKNHATEFNQSPLHKLGYISAVSGGSWAAASVKREKCPLCLFSNMEIALKYAGLCDNAPNKKACEQGLLRLNNSYVEAKTGILKGLGSKGFLAPYSGYTTREAWRSLLLKHHIGEDKDISMSELEISKDGKNANTKPFLVINTTHDTSALKNVMWGAKKGYPFEITGLGMGTIVDKGSLKGFNKTVGVTYTYRDNAGKTMATQPMCLSQAIAMSGAVIPPTKIIRPSNEGKLLAWDLPFPTSAVSLSEYHRSMYTLSDGGQSENLGALPLIERNVDLLIVSDMGYDKKYDCKDYATLKFQAQRLFNKNIRLNIPNTEDKDNELEAYYESDLSNKDEQYIFEGQFDGLHNTPKKLWYIKSPKSITKFHEYLIDHGYERTLNYLKFNKTSFPASKTFALGYKQELIFAYYLYGKFIAQQKLTKKLNEYVDQQIAQQECNKPLATN